MTGRNYPVTLPCVTIWFLRYEDKCSVSKDQCGFRMWSYVDISRNKASRQNIDCVGGNQRFEHVYYQVLKPRLLNKTGFYRIRKQKDFHCWIWWNENVTCLVQIFASKWIEFSFMFTLSLQCIYSAVFASLINSYDTHRMNRAAILRVIYQPQHGQELPLYFKKQALLIKYFRIYLS